MAQRWLRGVVPTHAPIADSFESYARVAREFNVFVYYFLRRMLGFTYKDEGTTDAGDTYENNHSVSGSDGVLTAADFSFTAASGSFAAGDIGKFICLVDPANDRNCGIYPIIGHTSATEIEIDYLSGPTDYPAAGTSIEWYLLDDDNSPGRLNDFWVLEAPHATSPYTMRGYNAGTIGTSFNIGTVIEISPFSAAWDDVGDAFTKPTMSTHSKVPRGYYSGWAHGPVYAYGDTDANFWVVWTKGDGGTSSILGGGIAIGEALETGRQSYEMVLPMGQLKAGDHNNVWYRNGSFQYSMSDGVFMNSLTGTTINTQWAGYHDSAAEYFARTLSGPNCRTGKRDGAPIFVFADYDGGDLQWAPLAKLPASHISLGSVNVLGDIVTFDSDQYMHVRHGVVVPWCGLPLS